MVDWGFDCHPSLPDVCANIKPGWSKPTEPNPVEVEPGMSHGCEHMPGQAVIEGPAEIAGEFGFQAATVVDLLGGEPVVDPDLGRDESGEVEEVREQLRQTDLDIYTLIDPDASLFDSINQMHEAGHTASPHYMLRPSPFWRGGPYSTVNRLDSQWTWDDLQNTGPSEATGDDRVVVIDTGGQGLAELGSFGIDCDPWETEPSTSPQFETRYIGHGTFVATVVKKYNRNLTVELYRGWSNAGFLNEFTLRMAFNRVPDLGTSVVNLSLGTYPCGPRYDPLVAQIDRVLDRGGRVVAAAGNDGAGHIPSRLYPASLSRVVGVGAFDTNWSHAQWSNPGEAWAPGEDIVSWYHDGATGSLAAWSGTSFATPHYAARKASGL